MRIFPAQQSREEYFETQIRRSENKFRYCKVSAQDVSTYRKVLRHAGAFRGAPGGPVLCLGTRNGREVDLFRIEWFGGALLSAMARPLERRTASFTSWLPLLESIGRSEFQQLTPTSVIGVELNPHAARPDVWIGSFDQMPAEWEGQFGVLYSNAFDQSEDPERTAREWKRVLRPGGYLIFCYTNNAEPSIHDRVGGLCLADVQALFGGRLLYFHDRGSRNRYSEVILQL